MPTYHCPSCEDTFASEREFLEACPFCGMPFPSTEVDTLSKEQQQLFSDKRMEGYRLRRLVVSVAVVPVLIVGVAIIKRIMPQSPLTLIVAFGSGTLLSIAFLIARPTRDELQLEKLERANRERLTADDDS